MDVKLQEGYQEGIAAVEGVLNALPSDPDEIADYLAGKGLVGSHQAHSCPIARLVKQETGHSVGATPFYVVVYQPQFGPPVHLDTPARVTEFIYRFDTDKYPELVDQG